MTEWDPKSYVENAGFVAELGMPLVALLAPQPGERILDLGCGDGRLTAKLVAAGCEVVAVDSSPAQVAGAQARGLDARLMDGEALTFADEFDAVFSNAALHWMLKPQKVIAGVRRALRANGRFVAEMGGAGNVATITQAIVAELAARGIDAAPYNPWYFPTPAEYTALLTAAGFTIHSMALMPRPTPLPRDLVPWLQTFANSFAQALPPNERPALFTAIQARLKPLLRDENGRWLADYVRLRFAAAR